MRNASILALMALVFMCAPGCTSLGRNVLFQPTHRTPAGQLTPQTNAAGKLVGWAREVDSPRSVWIVLHGNGGQAEDRVYTLPCFPADARVFVVEYPGYGTRPGTPSRAAFNQAAEEVYALMRASHPNLPIGVLGESLGSGPACHLATLPKPPDKIALVVPFDRLTSVARDHGGWLGASLVGANNWDNVHALSHYRGPVEIFAAAHDTVIPPTHARALAASVPQAKFNLLDGGHNDWPAGNRVVIRIP